MKNLFKNFDKMGLLAFVAAGLFAISWNLPESKMAPQWYAVTVSGTDPNPEKNQLIGAAIDEPTGNCSKDDGTICAVQLDLNSAPKPATIYQANQDGFDTDTRMHRTN
ncbi:hypothetical protein [Sphingobacterium kyonggiense]|nr:hypothetical protein [Sphingobacterium mizutaii]